MIRPDYECLCVASPEQPEPTSGGALPRLVPGGQEKPSKAANTQAGGRFDPFSAQDLAKHSQKTLCQKSINRCQTTLSLIKRTDTKLQSRRSPTLTHRQCTLKAKIQR